MTAVVFDLLIRGGQVADGTGAPLVRADVAVSAGRIVKVGRLPDAEGAAEFDATSCVVMPGLVDAHVHAEAAVFEPEVQLALLRQGVTTVVLGQDGLSFAPASPRTLAQVTRYFGAVNGRHPMLDPDAGVSVAGLLSGYDRRLPVNTAYLVPHGTVRYEVMGADPGPAGPDQLAAMRSLVEAGLSDGAVGLSSGLEYAPGSAAGVDELAHLTTPVADAGLPYVTHLRGYEDGAPVAMREALAIGRRAGSPVHVSHYHGPAEVLIPLVDSALGEGIDLTFDSYPYLRGSSILAMVALPPQLHSADLDRTLTVLADPATARSLEQGWFAQRPELGSRITLSHLPCDSWRWAEGLRLAQAAELAGLTPAALSCRLLVATELGAGCVFDHPHTNSEQSVRALLRHPVQLAGSDGIYFGGRPHPRGWGAFARLLGRHVRDLGDWTWGQAAMHLSASATRRFRLTDRGLVRAGQVADLVVLDPNEITDRADYAEPRTPADGVRHVFVSGVCVLTGGTPTPAARAASPGRALTPR